MEKIETVSGTSQVEVSQTICTNKTCQDLFEKNRAEEVLKINERKLKKEEQDKTRKKNIAFAIVERQKLKVNLRLRK